jgi:hypothetical protein
MDRSVRNEMPAPGTSQAEQTLNFDLHLKLKMMRMVTTTMMMMRRRRSLSELRYPGCFQGTAEVCPESLQGSETSQNIDITARLHTIIHMYAHAFTAQ